VNPEPGVTKSGRPGGSGYLRHRGINRKEQPTKRAPAKDSSDNDSYDNANEDSDNGMGINAVDSDLEMSESDGGLDTDEELELRETAAEKRLRLAKQYIDRLRTDNGKYSVL
jgi:hypothetical protein